MGSHGMPEAGAHGLEEERAGGRCSLQLLAKTEPIDNGLLLKTNSKRESLRVGTLSLILTYACTYYEHFI